MDNCAFDFSKTNQCILSIQYIRQDAGTVIIPWIYSLVLVLLHFPLVLVRVLKWDAGQMWSIAMAIFSLSLTSLAYQSTAFDPNQIYIWLPITLVIDVGAVMQVILLLIRTPANPDEPDGKQTWNWNFIIRGFRRYEDGVDPTIRNQSPEQNAGQHHGSQDRESIDWDSFRRSILLIVSIPILIGLVVLQSLGLHYALVGYRSSEPVFES